MLKVFHLCLHKQDQRSSFRGDQPHCGHRIRGPEGPRLSACSTSGLSTVIDLAEAFKGERIIPALMARPDSVNAEDER